MRNGFRLVVLSVLLTTIFYTVFGHADDFEMPFGLPMEPSARLLIGSTHDSPSGDRVESISRFATTATPQEVDAFYRSAMEAIGFLPSYTLDKGTSISVSGKRARDRIRISAKAGSDEVEASEVLIVIVAEYDR